MNDALFATQQAIAAALDASTELQALIGNPPRLYDHVPPGAAFPYIVFGPTSVLPYDNKAAIGFEQIVTLNIWSRYRGGKECREAFQAVYDALHRVPLSVSSQVFLSSEFHSADFGLDADGLTYHAAIRFILMTQTT